MLSGYYWCYTLDNQGEPLESVGRPIIIFYDADADEIGLVGYDLWLPFNPRQYRLLERIEYRDNPPN